MDNYNFTEKNFFRIYFYQLYFNNISFKYIHFTYISRLLAFILDTRWQVKSDFINLINEHPVPSENIAHIHRQKTYASFQKNPY